MQPSTIANESPLLKVLFGWIPNRMKRTMYLCSLTSVVKDKSVSEKELVRKLNELFGLADNDSGMMFPVVISSVVWINKEIVQNDVEVLTKSCADAPEAQASARRLAEAAPSWMRYGETQLLVKDLLQLFTQGKCLFHPHKAV